MGVNALCQIEKPATAAPFVRSSTVLFQAGFSRLCDGLGSAISGLISSCGCHAGWRCSKLNLSTVHWRISLTGTAIEKEHDGGVRGEAQRPHPPERLYVPVTRKVSLTGETFCTPLTPFKPASILGLRFFALLRTISMGLRCADE